MASCITECSLCEEEVIVVVVAIITCVHVRANTCTVIFKSKALLPERTLSKIYVIYKESATEKYIFTVGKNPYLAAVYLHRPWKS